MALRYLPSQPPTCAPLVYSGDVKRLHVSAASCFFSCCCMLPQLHLKCQQSLNNLAKTLGRDQNAGGLHVGSPPIHPTRLCLQQRVLGFPAACAALSSGDILYVVLRAGTAALLCNGLICNSLTYASYNDTLGFGKTALLIYMGENTPDDCYERDLRYLI